MPHQITLDHIPTGYALNSAIDGGLVEVARREFTSSEDGDLFITRLEGIPRKLLSLLPGYTIAVESTVAHMLAVIRNDKTATVYVNELEFIASARAKCDVKKGQIVTLDNILDIDRLMIENVKIAPDEGVVFVFSCGWRKGLFFDLFPLPPNNKDRDYDLESVLGFYSTYLYFQHIFSLSDAVWNEFFRQSWFPFTHLKQETVKRMIGTAKAGHPMDAHLDLIVREVEVETEARLQAWRSHPVLKSHCAVIEAAFTHFKNKDYLSASVILFPRIEGVMRSHHFNNPNPAKASQKNLAQSAITKAPIPSHQRSLLLPDRFERFLTEKYFAAFDPSNPHDLSRNTVSHGVVPESALNRKGACLGFLILLQLVSLMPSNVDKP